MTRQLSYKPLIIRFNKWKYLILNNRLQNIHKIAQRSFSSVCKSILYYLDNKLKQKKMDKFFVWQSKCKIIRTSINYLYNQKRIVELHEILKKVNICGKNSKLNLNLNLREVGYYILKNNLYEFKKRKNNKENSSTIIVVLI